MKTKALLLSIIISLLMVNTLMSQENYLPEIDAVPVDPAADEIVYRLKTYLADTYGKKIITGQMDLTWKDSVDMAQRVFDVTGKYPALMGYDLMNYKVGGGDGTKQIEEAEAWWNKGGIVTFCWHWRDPRRPYGYLDFYTEKTPFRIPYDLDNDCLDSKSPYYKGIIRDLDSAAALLKKLADKGIPVLWRPLHEASGGWFWWGASGSKPYLALYKFMFKYLTEEKGLHNLLWVWNGQDQDWYPGDEYVDIIGTDIYASTYETQYLSFNQNWYMSDDPDNNPKMITLSENGRIPDIDECIDTSTHWLYFMTWNDGNNNGDQDDNFWSGEKINTTKHKQKIYSSKYAVTLDMVPNIKTYPLRTK